MTGPTTKPTVRGLRVASRQTGNGHSDFDTGSASRHWVSIAVAKGSTGGSGACGNRKIPFQITILKDLAELSQGRTFLRES